MAFSFLVELLNMSVRKKQAQKLVELNEPKYVGDDTSSAGETSA
jgi:hypothetical protein